MQLAVGPVALVSLLTGNLVSQYNAAPASQDALNVGTQAALSVGIILTVLSILNLGSLVHYVAFPVMSGFTTGAAMIIGLTQIKNAFGFTNNPPQPGQTGFEYNYQLMNWYVNQWYDQKWITTTQGAKITYAPYATTNPASAPFTVTSTNTGLVYAPSQAEAFPVQNYLAIQVSTVSVSTSHHVLIITCYIL